jgi:hypothetical protein
LPLGSFVSRITADEALKTGNLLSSIEVFKEWIGHILTRVSNAKNLAKATDKTFQLPVDDILMELFNTLVSDHAADPKGGALLNGLDGIPGIVTWQDVEKRYGHIFSEWENSHADDVNAYYAIWCDAGNLDPAALSVFFYHEEAKIVICGHTHKPECTSALGDFDTRGIIIDTPVASGTNPIYANTGAWVNDTPRCTFVETEFDTAAGTHSVRLREWTQTANGQCVAQKVPLCPDESLSV